MKVVDLGFKSLSKILLIFVTLLLDQLRLSRGACAKAL